MTSPEIRTILCLPSAVRPLPQVAESVPSQAPRYRGGGSGVSRGEVFIDRGWVHRGARRARVDETPLAWGDLPATW